MRIHHLNCGTMCPLGRRLLGSRPLCCHCLLIEAPGGLILVDTGFGTEDVERPQPRLSRLFSMMTRPEFDLRDTAVEQVLDLGFKPADVRHIVLTHMDFDHAGGVADFPGATVHVLADEAAAARHRHGWVARRRYRPAQWRATARWQEYKAAGDKWFGFDAVREMTGLPPEILLVPLPGHSVGHTGVAIKTGDGWLLHAGDAYLHHAEMDPANPSCPRGLRLLQWTLQADAAARHRNQKRLRELITKQPPGLTVICSHDLDELQVLQRKAEAEARQRAAPALPARDGVA